MNGKYSPKDVSTSCLDRMVLGVVSCREWFETDCTSPIGNVKLPDVDGANDLGGMHCSCRSRSHYRGCLLNVVLSLEIVSQLLSQIELQNSLIQSYRSFFYKSIKKKSQSRE